MPQPASTSFPPTDRWHLVPPPVGLFRRGRPRCPKRDGRWDWPRQITTKSVQHRQRSARIQLEDISATGCRLAVVGIAPGCSHIDFPPCPAPVAQGYAPAGAPKDGEHGFIAARFQLEHRAVASSATLARCAVEVARLVEQQRPVGIGPVRPGKVVEHRQGLGLSCRVTISASKTHASTSARSTACRSFFEVKSGSLVIKVLVCPCFPLSYPTSLLARSPPNPLGLFIVGFSPSQRSTGVPLKFG